MGTLNFTVGRYAKERNSNLISTDIRTSDAYTTSTSATFVEDGSGDITLAAGEIFRCSASEPAWIRFGGDTATVGDGFYMLSSTTYEWEVDTAGKVSVIDVS